MHSLLSSTAKTKNVHQKIKYVLGQVGGRVLGAVSPARQAKLPRVYNLNAHVFSRRFASTHYGIMIPDLPEPFRYMSYASVIGDVGADITKTSKKISMLLAEEIATFVHGTALSETKDAFKVYAISEQLKFQQQPFQIQYADDSSLTQEADHYHLVTHMNGLQVDLILKPTDAITWFSYGPFYQHFSVLMHYEGVIIQQGITRQVTGLFTLEHWKAVTLSMLPQKFLLNDFTLPMTSFTYQVINLNDQEQLVLAFVGFLGQPAYTAISYRHVNGTSIQYDDAHFEVTTLQEQAEITPDGFAMQVPKFFTWRAKHHGQWIVNIVAEVDTAYCYGLAAGYVTSYKWQGEFNQKIAEGRGYLEYIDRRIAQ